MDKNNKRLSRSTLSLNSLNLKTRNINTFSGFKQNNNRLSTSTQSHETSGLHSDSVQNSEPSNSVQNSVPNSAFKLNSAKNYQEPVQIHKEDSTAPVHATQICNFLWLGNLDNAQDTNFLTKNNITHLINISTYDYENGLPASVNQNNYLHIKILDSDRADLLPHLDGSMKFLKRAHVLWEDSNSQFGTTLVHCQAGISRSSSVVIAFIMNHRHMGWRRSYDYVKARRPSICPNINFTGQLIEYEKELAGKNIIKNYQKERDYDSEMESNDSLFSLAPSESIPDAFQPINWQNNTNTAKNNSIRQTTSGNSSETNSFNNCSKPRNNNGPPNRPKFLKINKYMRDINCMNTRSGNNDSDSTASSGIGACCGLKTKKRPNSLNFSSEKVQKDIGIDSDITPTQENQAGGTEGNYSRHLCGIGKGAKNMLDRGAKTMNTMKRVMTTYSRQSSSGSGNQTGNNRSALNSRTRNSQSLNETSQKIINFDIDEVVSFSNDNISNEGNTRRLHGRKELDSIILNGPVLPSSSSLGNIANTSQIDHNDVNVINLSNTNPFRQDLAASYMSASSSVQTSPPNGFGPSNRTSNNNPNTNNNANNNKELTHFAKMMKTQGLNLANRANNVISSKLRVAQNEENNGLLDMDSASTPTSPDCRMSNDVRVVYFPSVGEKK